MLSIFQYYRQYSTKIRVLGLILLIICALSWLINIGSLNLPINDFTLYWSSSKLLLSGDNPYDSQGLWMYQQQESNNAPSVVLMFYPPWSLLFTLPFGLFDREIGQIIWILINTTALFVCTDKLWEIISSSTRQKWLAWLIAFSFGPAFAALGYTGQITPFFLIGFTGIYLYIGESRKDWLSGFFLLLTAIKPQVPFLFLILLALWAFHQRRYNILFSFLLNLGAATALVMIFDNQIIFHFFENLFRNTPIAWATPTIGTYLRYYLGFNGFWLQFIPPIITGIVTIEYWRRKRDNWDWKTALPWILFLTVISSPYTWTYDFVILLIPLLIGFNHLLSHVPKWPALLLTGVYISINLAYWWLHLRYDDFYFIWFAPALFIWYIMVQAVRKYYQSIA